MKIVTILAAATLGAALTACSVGAPAELTAEAQPGTNRAADVEPSAAAEPEPSPAQDGPAKFGQTFTYANGVSVTVSKPKAFKPSEYAAAEKSAAYVMFDVTIVNGSKENFDPSMSSATIQSNNAEGDSVFDSSNGLGGSPSTTVLPGRETKYKIGFGVANASDLVLEITAGIVDFESVIFTT